ncbi:MAG: hypothetical protein WC382_06390 [Methanoregulaceae archaeon]|jgi:hypothetical protein
MKPGLTLSLGFLLVISIICAGCQDPDDNGRTITPVPTTSVTTSPEDAWGTLSLAALLAKGESREALTRAAYEVQQGDTGWLVDALPPEVQEQLGEKPAISEADAAEIAQALRDAKEVEMHENLILYETTYQGKTHSFYSVREFLVWKIVGF